LSTSNCQKLTEYSPICPVCLGWLEEKDGYLRCMSCPYRQKFDKKIITPIGGESMGPGISDSDSFNSH
jgi:tRNA(Ile2) C34 agmatinyltransferase TiaS